MDFLNLKSKRFIIRTITHNECTKNYLNWLKKEKFIEFRTNKNINLKNLKTFINKKKNPYFFAIFYKSKRHIGNIKFERLKNKIKCFEVGILVGDEKWKYKGVFREVYYTIVPHIYYLENISKIYLGVDKKNLSAIKTFKKTGFKINKIKKRSFLMEFALKNKFHDISRLTIGTAQLMNKYGFFKNDFRKQKNMNKLLSLCKDYKILKMDLAFAYNNYKYIKKFKYFSKFNINLKVKNLKHLNYIYQNDKEFKNINIMLHDESLLDNKKLRSSLLKRNNLGLSIYQPSQLKYIKLLKSIQFPLSVFNQSFISKHSLKLIKNGNCQLHARSIFLQGLLLNRKLPQKFDQFRDIHSKWFSWLDTNNLNPVNVCLNFVLNINCIDEVVIGVNSLDELNEIIQNLWIKKDKINSIFSKVNTRLSNVDKWKKM